jgi:alkylation response protein AidB-like acyl-CoA dehydrogenase
MLFFPASDAQIDPVWEVSGLRGTGSDTVRVTDLFVPEHRTALHGQREPGPLYALGTNQVFQAGFASVALGTARATLDALIELASGKTARGMSSRLREHHMVQSRVAVAEATLGSARAYFRKTVDDLWRDTKAAGAVSMEHRVRLRLATTFTMHQCAAVVDSAYHTAGGDAIFQKQAFERRFRDMHAVTQQVQARQDHYEAVGAYFLGLEPDRSFL